MADRTVVYSIRGNITDLQAKMVAAGHSVSAFADKTTAATKEGAKMRAGLTTLGGAAGKMGLVAAAGLGVAVVASANFDQAMSKVAATGDDARGSIDALREAAIQAGADTAFSASEAAAGITNLAKAGLSADDILAGGLTGTLDLAAAGELDVATAAEIAAVALKQFGLDGDQATHVADLLAAASGLAMGEVTDMATSLKYVGPVAAQMGVSIEETTGTIALLAEQGILGEQAGTSLRGMLTGLTSPSKLAATEMEKLGITMYDASGQFIGLDGVAGQLHDKMGDLTNAERDEALGRIFGNEQITAARILYKGGAEAVQQWTTDVNDSGFAAEQAAQKLDNLKGDLEQFMGSLETALIGAGDGTQAPLRRTVQGATDAVNALNDLPDSAKNATTGLLGIVAVTGGTLWFSSKVISGIADTRLALSQLGTTGARTGRILKTALVGVAVLEGLNLLDEAIDGVFDHDLNTSNLGRSLDALAGGRVQGELLSQFGGDLAGFGQKAAEVTSETALLSRALRHIPLAGGFMAGSIDDDIENIEKMDAGLASMVESGNGEAAAAIFERLDASMKAAGVDASDRKALFEQYGIAVGNAGDATGDAVAPTDALTGATGELGTSMDKTAAKAMTLENAMALLFGGLDAQAALDAWTAGIKKLGKELDGGAGALDRHTKKGRENREEIRASLDLLRQRAEAEYEETGNLDLLEKRLIAGRQAILDQAVAAGIGKDEMHDYLKELGLTPKEIRTTVELMGAPEATAKAQAFKVVWDAIRDKTVTITTIMRTQGQTAAINRGRAAGGHITGPGSATSDSIPAYLSNGEYVIRAAAVAKYGTSMFDGLNAMRYGSGGSVNYDAMRSQRAQTSHSYQQAAPIDYDRLAAATKSAPMIGHLTVPAQASTADAHRTISAVVYEVGLVARSGKWAE